MKTIRHLSIVAAVAAILAGPFAGYAADDKAKAYPLDKCVVSDEKLGEMGKPFVFDYKGQEIKLCCKNCKKDFDKDPAKYLKKMASADKGQKPSEHEGHNH